MNVKPAGVRLGVAPPTSSTTTLIPAKPPGPAGSQFSSKSIHEEIMNTKYPSHASIAGLLVVVFASVAFAQSEQIGKKPSVE